MKQGVLCPVLCYLLLLLAVSGPKLQAAARTQTVSNDAELVAALGEPAIDRIQLLSDVYLKDTSGDWSPYKPVLQGTNLTIDGCPTNGSTVCSTDANRILDFGYLSGLVLMDSNVTVTLSNIVLANVRKPAGVGLDLFVGRQGSRVVYKNGLGYRLACSPSNFQTQALQSAPATNADSRAVNVLESFCWRGTCYPNTLVAPVNTDNSVTTYGRDDGFTFELINTTRLCVSYWPLECLNKMTSDQCNEYYTDLALAQLTPAPSKPSPVVIAVPVAVGGAALLCGLLAFVLLRRRRQDKRQAAEAVEKINKKDVESGEHTNGVTSSMGPLRLGNGSIARHDSNWQLLACHTNPDHETSSSADDDIQLGVLVGAGASGRVYRGRWRNTDVAVKVLQHDAGTATAIANETDLMMGFDHPNVVRAYHVVSWRRCSGRTNMHSTASEIHPKSAKSNLATVALSSVPSSVSTPPVISEVLFAPEGGSGKLDFNGTRTSGDNAMHASWSKQSSGTLQHRSGTPLHHSGGNVLLHVSEEGGGGRRETATTAIVSEEQWDDSDSRSGWDDMAQTWLVQEFCDGGTLADAVRAARTRGSNGKPQMAKVLTRLHDVACGMRYLHARNVIHRDLKACNVLLVSDPAAPFGQRAKVADFGLSTAMRPGQTHHSTRTLGTISHMAPELLRAGKQSPAADVYAFGIVMWELAVGRSAFGNAHYGEVFERVAIAGERPPLDPVLEEALGEEYMMLMRACWNGDPMLRPTFEQVVTALDVLVQACQEGAEGLAESHIAGFSAALAVSHSVNVVPQRAVNGGERPGSGLRTSTTHVFDGEWDL